MEGMPAISRLIREHHAEIVERWAERAHRAASARGLERPELLDIVPDYVAALGTEDGDGRAELIESHFATRLRQGFHVGEMVDELSLIATCIAETWESEPPAGHPPAEEIERLFFDEIQLRIVELGDLFAAHMEEDEQADKRTSRLLDEVAARQRTSPRPLQRVLEELVAIAAEAMGVPAATVLVYDTTTSELAAVASAGLAGGAVERYVTSSRARPFESRVHAAARAEQEEVATLELGAGDALGPTAIRSLLGVRLPPRNRIVATLYVGLEESRRFTAREVRRLETIGERLVVHLDGVELEEELRRAIAELRSERAMREQFVALLAHDLRGPLSAARAGASMLARDPAPERRRELAAKVARNIDRTDRMVRDLLDANRLRAGEPLPIHVSRCDLTRIAREVIGELEAAHGDRFVLDAPCPVEGRWDPDELRRALWNLGSNAVKYGARGAPITFRVARSGDRAIASVHNEGPALPAADLARLFEPFTRLPDGAKRGWGLGLVLVRGAAEAHGGRATAESGEGGTTFAIELPTRALVEESRPAPAAR